jgi:hypothetical protein
MGKLNARAVVDKYYPPFLLDDGREGLAFLKRRESNSSSSEGSMHFKYTNRSYGVEVVSGSDNNPEGFWSRHPSPSTSQKWGPRDIRGSLISDLE